MPSKTVEFTDLNVAQPTPILDAALRNAMLNNNIFVRDLYKTRKTFDGGTYVEVPILKNFDDAEAFTKFTSTTLVEEENLTMGRWPVCYYKKHIAIHDIDDVANSGPDKLLDLMTVKYQAAQMGMESVLEKDVAGSTGGVTNHLDGLPLMVADAPATGTIGGLDRATETYMQNQTTNFNGVVANLKIDDIDGLYYDCSFGSAKPKIGWTSKTIFKRIKQIGQAMVQASPDMIMKFGADTLQINGCPIKWSDQISTRFYWLNTDFIQFRVDKKRDMFLTPFIPDQVSGWQVKTLLFYAALVCTCPKYQGVLYGIS